MVIASRLPLEYVYGVERIWKRQSLYLPVRAISEPTLFIICIDGCVAISSRRLMSDDVCGSAGLRGLDGPELLSHLHEAGLYR